MHYKFRFCIMAKINLNEGEVNYMATKMCTNPECREYNRPLTYGKNEDKCRECGKPLTNIVDPVDGINTRSPQNQ